MELDDRLDPLEQFFRALSGECGNKHDLRVRDEREYLPHAVRVLFYRVIILFHRIPFIDGDDQSLSPVVGDARYFRVLLRHSLDGVNHQNDDVRALDRRHGPDNTISF